MFGARVLVPPPQAALHDPSIEIRGRGKEEKYEQEEEEEDEEDEMLEEEEEGRPQAVQV